MCGSYINLLSNGKCSICPIGTFQYLDNNSIYQCNKCHRNCKSCDNYGFPCLSCYDNINVTLFPNCRNDTVKYNFIY